ncbi:exonuclease RecJ [Halobaculum magnesiiphilum]|uniref:Exonuclease RecJ n=1 Tax=Halobaculum magnesiiphilum TaxID=1017351 RepID=A0A8T8WD26_9EURY|nr:exonuclease RecJ [Halobaculum magnesiiphilum]QZP37735.1 exonuclease RecJ [Halobaculum magnesiiphilum]
MSTAADAPTDADPERVASALSTAEFVRIYPRPTGDALAAAGVLARALDARDTAFQVRATRDEAIPDGDGSALALGWTPPNATGIPSGSRPVSAVAADVADAVGVEPDPIVGLAGVVAAGTVPGEGASGSLLEEAERRGVVDRRPGVAVPTADLADGLAHSTRIWTPYSGDPDAARELLADLGIDTGSDGAAEIDEDAHRRLASAVALDATADAPDRAVSAVERALRPYATSTGPFETLGGHADVFDALARERPGLGVALALGADVTDAALSTWRDHAGRVHAALADPTTGRYDGAFVVRVEASPADAPALATAARLVREYASPEPVALVVSDDAAAAAGDGAADTIAALQAGVEATTDADPDDASAGDTDRAEETNRDGDSVDVFGDDRLGEARFAGGDVQAFIGAFREALR